MDRTERSPTALVLIDVINDLNFAGGDALLSHALVMAKHIIRVKARATQFKMPVIYVNDNFGQWKSDFRHTVDHCCAKSSRGSEISRMLRPSESDYFVLKPRHSGFYATTFEVLLEYLRVDRLILTGIAANICVLFTANDAYMRGFGLTIPADCVASNTSADTAYSLQQMKTLLKADVRPSDQIDLRALSRPQAHDQYGLHSDAGRLLRSSSEQSDG